MAHRMGKTPDTPPVAPHVLEGFRQRLAELEALGIDTSHLKTVLERDPASFESAAEDALRRELSGEETPPALPAEAEEVPTPAPPDESPPVETPPEAVPATEPELEETPAVAPESLTPTPEVELKEPVPTPTLPTPELDEISQLERKLA